MAASKERKTILVDEFSNFYRSCLEDHIKAEEKANKSNTEHDELKNDNVE